MTNTVQQPSLFVKSNKLAQLQDKWQLAQTISAGTFAMRDAATQYLPRLPKESAIKYSDRLNRAVLNETYTRSIERSVGKALTKPLTAILPAQLESMLLNVDSDGTSLESFTKQLLNDTINYGVTYTLVDMPSSSATTLYEQRLQNNSPYFVKILPTQLLDLRTDYINNKLQLTYFRFYEQTQNYSDTSSASETIEQVREFVLEDGAVTYNIYRKTKEGQEYLAETGQLSIDYIPIVANYGKKVGAYLGEPVLEGLAHLTVKYWQDSTDLSTNVRYGLTPILALKGIQAQVDPATGKTDTEDFTISSSAVLALPSDGSLEWTRADAPGILAASSILDKLEKQMADSGLELTSQQQLSAVTATQRIMDQAEANSILKSICVDLAWTLYQAVVMAGDYIGIDASESEITIDTSFTVANTVNTQDLQLLLQLFQAGAITAEELRIELHARKIFASEQVNEILLTGTPVVQEGV